MTTKKNCAIIFGSNTFDFFQRSWLATVIVTTLDAALSNQTLDVFEISSCNHEEADTRMFLRVKRAKSNAVI